MPPPTSSLTPDPKFRRSIYRSVKDINERLERALAAVLDRIKTSGELLRTASQVRKLRSRNTSTVTASHTTPNHQAESRTNNAE